MIVSAGFVRDILWSMWDRDQPEETLKRIKQTSVRAKEGKAGTNIKYLV